MSDLPPLMDAEMAISRQKATFSMIKQSSDMDKKLVAMIEQSLHNVPVSSSRGTQFNATA